MSDLKVKLARKMSKLLGREVSADDICFMKNGRRRDVVRWTAAGYECFAAAAFSARADVSLAIAEQPQSSGFYEIYAEQSVAVELPPSKPNPFDTSFR